MPPRPKRKQNFDPTASDPEDEDWDATPKKGERSARRAQRGGARPTKKPRRNKYDTDDDEDVLNDSEESEEAFQEDDDDEEDEGGEASTGRRTRKAAARKVNYNEDSEIEESEEEREAGDRRERKKIIKLRIGRSRLNDLLQQDRRSSVGGKGPKTAQNIQPTRRSSRFSHEPEAQLMSLTNSGRHAIREGTRSPVAEIYKARQTRASKGLKKPPSAIFEETQEIPMTQEDEAEEEETKEELIDDEPEAEEVQEIIAHVAETPPDLGTQASVPTLLSDLDQIVKSSQPEIDDPDPDDDDDEGPVQRSKRPRRASELQPIGRSTRLSQKRREGESSDFDPDAEAADDENMSDDDEPPPSRQKSRSTTDEEIAGRRSTRLRRIKPRRSHESSDEHEEGLDPDELAEEADELAADHAERRRSRRRHTPKLGITYDDAPKALRTRAKGKPDYRIIRPELAIPVEDDDEPGPSTAPHRSRRGGGTSTYRSLFSTLGPFGGAGGPPPLFGGPEGFGAAGGVDSDTSDDEPQRRGTIAGIGGTVGMTPTSATAPLGLFPQPHNTDPLQGPSGTPAQFGKVKDKKALADADPLGVDPNVSFEGVGGLDNHINQLKEMVVLPLLYPEVFQRFHVTPPRGVLFHGPPGTGKTLLARALASSVSSQGRKVTFYMRKGADALSKWVGEAERQLRLLFEEARKTQPSIIFFDEIDGLAPVRSSKQEQIHASIVATLLALMDGMDGRGQVIVIGATNRPDSVDPALRRPGRFDREFYFPLPNTAARRSIIDIHTKNWEPPLIPAFKDQLAELTKGYGGADLRALCTEAALNAVQGTYPQIYQSEKKLIIDPSNIRVLAKDFMISVNKMVPSSERSTSSGAAPLAKSIEPLLRFPLKEISKILDDLIPQKKKLSALEEAQYDDRDDDRGFQKETMQRDFERARIFRPRLLIKGGLGMGQQYLGAALLNKFEHLHVQSFDLPTLLEDSTRTPEAGIVQLFKEVRRHRPSVIYIPNVDIWYGTVGETVKKTFTSLLRTLPPNDPILVLGIMEQSSEEKPDPTMVRELFGYSGKNQYTLDRPHEVARHEFFRPIIDYVRTKPSDFPAPENRRKRILPTLPVAPEAPSTGPTKEELKEQKKRDRLNLNILKMKIQPVMDEIKKHHKKFRNSPIDEHLFAYLVDENDPNKVTTDLPPEEQRQSQQLFRPYERDQDKNGIWGLRDVASNKFFYNLNTVVIEQKLSNGHYKRPKDFLADIRRINKDAENYGDPERIIKANEMLSNVEVDMAMIEQQNPALMAELEAVYQREVQRLAEELKKNGETSGHDISFMLPNVPPNVSSSTESTGPVVIGAKLPSEPPLPPFRTPVRPSTSSNGTSLTNGDESLHGHSNGSTIPSRYGDDVLMPDSQEEESLSGEDEPRFSTPNQPNIFTQDSATQRSLLSQVSAHTRMLPGTVLADYQNSASTTTSGNRTGSGSNRSSLPFTQSTNGSGKQEHPDFDTFMGGGMSGGSQIPDTQTDPTANSTQSSMISNSQSSEQSTQPQYPPRPGGSIMSLLNTEHERPAGLLLDENLARRLHDELARSTSGLSIEQLEQVNAVLMETLWRTRGQWNRNVVMKEVGDAFNIVLKDIEEIQRIEDPSQELRRVGL